MSKDLEGLTMDELITIINEQDKIIDNHQPEPVTVSGPLHSITHSAGCSYWVDQTCTCWAGKLGEESDE